MIPPTPVYRKRRHDESRLTRDIGPFSTGSWNTTQRPAVLSRLFGVRVSSNSCSGSSWVWKPSIRAAAAALVRDGILDGLDPKRPCSKTLAGGDLHPKIGRCEDVCKVLRVLGYDPGTSVLYFSFVDCDHGSGLGLQQLS